MFFDNLKKRKACQLTALPLIPQTDWRPPQEFPDLSNAPWVAFDVETYDPELLTRGPGWARKSGHIVGISLATAFNCWYFPVDHSVQSNLNLDKNKVLTYIRSVLETTCPKIGANLIYDIGWLTENHINVQGELHDVQFAEALLTDVGNVSLDFLGNKYVGVGKQADTLYDWCAKAYGGKPNSDQRDNIWRAPPSLVGPYAEQDASLPFQILQRQWPQLEKQGLLNVYRLECDLIYPLIHMRRNGVRIDLDYAVLLKNEFDTKIAQLERAIHDEHGFNVNVEARTDLVKLFTNLGIDYPKTALGNPSFAKDFLDTIDHPIAEQIKEIRYLKHLSGTFIQNYLLEANVNGRIHCQFHPLRNPDGGARTGRFAGSDPNLQNIPARTEAGKKVRQCFIPDEGDEEWEKDDYSQIEYRLLAHHAVGPGSDNLRQRYCDDPDTDYHNATQQAIKERTGLEIDRRPIKNINFGFVYGMGEAKLARMLGLKLEPAREIFEAYHQGNPYVKSTMEACSTEANLNGYITTILGRRTRFDLWERRNNNDHIYMSYENALIAWGGYIKRAFLHKAINYRLQGGAADIMKIAMWKCWKAGIYDYIGYPKLTVHDELDFSVKTKDHDEAYAEMRRIMETAISLKVPVRVDSKRSANWGLVD